MKTTKTILIITITALLAVAFCGCNEVNPSSDVVEMEIFEVIEYQEDQEIEYQEKEVQNYDSDFECDTPSPIMILINDNPSFKDEIIKHINLSKSLRKDDANYAYYSINKISDIKEFYSLDDFKIDGYELYCIDVGEAGFAYYYVSVNKLEELKSDPSLFSSCARIEIIIARPDYQYFYFSEWLEGLAQEGEVTNDGFIYAEKYNDISIQMGDTILTIRVPEKLNNYEYLRDLCYKVIETSELVVVEG